MTTIIGLRHPEIPMGVLVADRQTTQINAQTGFPSGKSLGRKLWASEDSNYCFGHSGNRDQDTERFVQGLVQGEFDVKQIVEKGYFPALRKLNVKRMGKHLPDLGKLSSFVLATRFDEDPKLYGCWPLGAVEERVWTTVGSGDQKVNEYMDALNVLNASRDYIASEPIKAEDIIRVGLEAVRRAQGADLYSHGLDMMVCTPAGINDHYAELGDDFRKKLMKLQGKYRGQK
jgi:hypothetical protein